LKVFISSDIEGTAGIVDWQQVIGPGVEYEMGRRLLLGEVNAAIDGAIEGGATEIVVNDSHWLMQNLPPDELHGRASYISGKHKPLYMMEGLDATFDAVFFVSYHGSVGAEGSVLSHTYNPSAIGEVRLDGEPVGESAVNGLVASHFKVPVALITGDRHTIEESRRLMPGAEGVVVKESLTRFASHSLHPESARELIRLGAHGAAKRARSLKPPVIDKKARLDVSLLTADMAMIATWCKGVERSGPRSVVIEGDDHLQVYRSFVALTYLTRSVAER
jgi:D-amino peptidase